MPSASAASSAGSGSRPMVFSPSVKITITLLRRPGTAACRASR